MAQISQIGIPTAAKNSNTSRGVGAAPVRNHSDWSTPSLRRIFEPTSAAATFACSSKHRAGGLGHPARRGHS